MNNLRLLPIVLFALFSLLALKVNDLMDHVGLQVSGPTPAFAEPGTRPAVPPVMPAKMLDITGSAEKPETPAEPEKPAGEADKPADHDAKTAGDTTPAAPETTPAIKPVQTAEPLAADASGSQAERALLERLQQRREQLDQQARDLDTRENLLRAAEKRIQDRIAELKQLEAGAQGAEAKTVEADNAKVKTLVVMYETMKPKDAARIFNKLDLPILVDVSSAMKPAKLADVLAAMDSDAAKRLTVALANKFSAKPAAPATEQPALDLPKIEGQPPKG